MMAAIGVGAVCEGPVVMSLGSSGTAFAYSTRPAVDPRGEAAAFCDSTGGWLPRVCTLNCTVATEWLRELFGLDHAGVEAVLAASAGWAQLCADAFQLPVIRPPKIEAAAVGGARQVRWAVDDVPVDAAASIGRRFDPTPSGALQAGLERASHLRDVVVRNDL